MSEIKVGDRVKVEFEGVLEYETPGSGKFCILGDDGKKRYWFEHGDLTVLPKPIVLPTKRNALIEIGSLVLIRGTRSAGYPWISSNFNEYSNEEMTQWAKDKPEAYRVIFEGEDDD